MAAFGVLLEELRRSRKLSQAKLAEALGWRQSKVSYLEAATEVPKEDELREICEFFGVTPEYFYERRREDKTPRAADYLRRLVRAEPNDSPKAAFALAFYSGLDQLSKEEQDEAVRLADDEVRRRKKPRSSS